jgi:uncharacterized membrane protein
MCPNNILSMAEDIHPFLLQSSTFCNQWHILFYHLIFGLTQVVKRDTIVAIAETVTEIQPEVEIQAVRTTTEEKIREELPDKIETLWQNSSEYLNQDERVQLR